MPVKRKKKTKRINGDGSISQRPNGTYRWQFPYTVDGKQTRKSGSAPTAAAAQEALDDFKVSYRRGELVLASDRPFGEHVDRWIAKKATFLQGSTASTYRTYLSTYVPEWLREMQAHQITQAHLEALDLQLTTRKTPLKQSSRRKVFSLLSQVFDDSRKAGHLRENPCRDLKIRATAAEKSAAPRRKHIEPEDVQRFMAAAREHEQYALFYSLFSLGLRRGEALGLRWQDVDLDRRRVSVRQQVRLEGNKAVIGTLKTRSAYRSIAFDEGQAEVFAQQRDRQAVWRAKHGPAMDDHDLVFTTKLGTLIHPRNVNRDMHGLCRQAGITEFSSHSGRHTSISARLQLGHNVDVVAAAAGHRDSRVTQSVYRGLFNDERQGSVLVLNQFLATGKKSKTP
jgi:integrase